MSNYVNMSTIIPIMLQLCPIMSQLFQLFVWQFLDYYDWLFDNPEMNNDFNYVDPIILIMSKPMYMHVFPEMTPSHTGTDAKTPKLSL